MITYFNIGKEQGIEQNEIEKEIQSAEWQELKKGDRLPFSQGYAIQEMIKQFRIPKVSHVSIYGGFDGMGFYGIRGHFANGIKDIFFLDDGCSLTPMATVHH